MTRITLWGAWYESKNAGDQAILMAIAAQLASRIQDLHLTVFSNRSLVTDDVLRSVRCSNLRYKIVSQRKEFMVAVNELRKSHMFLVGGGTPIYNDRFHLFALLVLVGIARICGVRVMTYAISARPVNDYWARLFCRLALRLIPLITLRESDSLPIIQELLAAANSKVEVYVDPAVAYPYASVSVPSDVQRYVSSANAQDRPLIAICPHFFTANDDYHVHHYERYEPSKIENYYEALARVCDQLTRRSRLLFLPMNVEEPDSDLTAIQSILERMTHPEDVFPVMGELSPEQIVGLLRSCELVVGSRLHSLIFASVARTPMIAISYGPKISGFMDKLGFRSQTHTLAELNASSLWRSVERAWNDREALRRKLSSVMSELEHLASQNAARATHLVTR